MERTTASGLVIHERAFPRDINSDPRSNPPNDNGPGPNVPAVSVGPTSSEGVGNTLVMGPEAIGIPQVQPWSGWPDGWATPMWDFQGADWLGHRLSIVGFCLDLNGSILATMPVYCQRANQIIPSPTWAANPEPTLYSGGWPEMFKILHHCYVAVGEAFLYVTGRYHSYLPARFVVLNPYFVNVDWVDGLRRYSLGGEDITDDVLHIRYDTWPGDARGHGPLETAAQTIMGAEAMERYAANLAARGGIPWAVIKHPDDLTSTQTTDLQGQWVRSRNSAAGAPAVLSGGIDLQTVTINPKDMALLELRQFDDARLALVLGVPPELAGLPSGNGSMTYRNSEAIYDYHWRAFLRPRSAMIMTAMSMWLTALGTSVELNRDEYVRGAPPDRANYYSTMFGIFDPATGERAITIDEIRQLERMVVDSTSSTATTVSGLSSNVA